MESPLSLIEFRRYLHAHPELSGQEVNTANIIREELAACHPNKLITNLGGTGVLAEFDSGVEGPVLLFRSELDALPIEELNDFDHRSKVANISHKCGHDGHMAILVGLARSLKNQPITRGKVWLLFQPAEETGEGAKTVIADERFNDVKADLAFALHNLPSYPKHTILSKIGAITPAVKSLIIQLEGTTAHAAEPEKGRNPALAIAAILELSQSMAILEKTDSDYFLITPIHVVMGEKAYGVSAGYGEVHFTVRAHTNLTIAEKEATFLGETRKIAQKFDLQVSIKETDEFKSNNNDESAFELLKEAAQIARLDFVEMKEPLSWGEDFGLFTERFPGALFGLGAGLDHPALHQGDYDFPDELLDSGLRVFEAIFDKKLR